MQNSSIPGPVKAQLFSKLMGTILDFNVEQNLMLTGSEAEQVVSEFDILFSHTVRTLEQERAQSKCLSRL